MSKLIIGCLTLLLLCLWSWSDPAQAVETEVYVGSATDLSAREIFRQAYEHRYTWDESFPGYRAEVSLMIDQEQYHGFVIVRPDLSYEVLNISNDQIREEVEAQLGFEMTHRQRVPFEAIHGDSQFEQVENDGNTLLIRETNGDEQSSYRIKDGTLIAQVNRTLIPGELAATVDTLTWLTSSEGAIPQVYQTVFRDPESGEFLEQDNIRDIHQRIGKYYLLVKRQIRYGQETGPKSKPLPDTWFQFNTFLPLEVGSGVRESNGS